MAKAESNKRGRPKRTATGTVGLGAPATSDATIGFEAKLWQAADKLRNNMDAAEYKRVVLGLIFLKFSGDLSIGAAERLVEEVA